MQTCIFFRRQHHLRLQRSKASQGQGPAPIVRRAVRSVASKGCVSVRTKNGGAERDRTADPLLAKQVLSQLSYSPNSLGTARTDKISQSPFINTIFPQNPSSRSNPSPHPPNTNKRMVGLGRLELPTPRLSSVCSNQLSYRPIHLQGIHLTSWTPSFAAIVFLKKEKRSRRFSPYPLSAEQIWGVLRCDRDLTGPILS